MATQLDIPAYNDENDELTALVAKLLLGKLRCHLGITCDSCLRMNFFGYRYKCAVCDNYDLCSDCFEDRKQSGDHKTNHPLKVIRSPDVYSRFSTLFGLGLPILQLLLLEKNATHDVSCNSCDDGNPVKGILFICDDCRGYRLCYSCFEAEKVTGSHERFHCLLIRVTPRSYRIQGSNITLIKKLGAGSFGEVYRCTINGVTAAIKLCNTKDLTTLSGKERQSLENEIQIYQEFFCNYIVEIKGFGEGSGNKLFLVLEYLSEGNLEEHMKKQSYARVSKRRRFYFCENIIRGLVRMHRKGIIHKDLKPDNIFLTDNDTLKLGDLGIAFNPDSTSQGVKRIHQQLYYPTNDPNSSHPSYDIYAFGLLVNEIMTGQRNTKLSPEDCKEAEKVPYFGDMIAACISQNGRDRPTTACVKQHLLNFHQYLDKQSKQNEKKYEQETLERRNEIFDKAYQSFSAQVRFVNEVDDAYQERPLPQGIPFMFRLYILKQQ